MRTKVLAVRSILQMTENRAKCCQLSGHVRPSCAGIGRENCILRRGSAGTRQWRCTTALSRDDLPSFVLAC